MLSVDTEEPSVYESFLKEVELNASFRYCPHIVHLLGASTRDRAHCALIMELAEEGNLAQRIYDPHKRRLDTLQVRPGGGWCVKVIQN